MILLKWYLKSSLQLLCFANCNNILSKKNDCRNFSGTLLQGGYKKLGLFLLPYRGFMFPVIAVESATEIKANAWIIGKD